MGSKTINKTIFRKKRFYIIILVALLASYCISLFINYSMINASVDQVKQDIKNKDIESALEEINILDDSIHSPLIYSLSWIPVIGKDISQTQEIITELNTFCQDNISSRITDITDIVSSDDLFSQSTLTDIANFITDIRKPIIELSKNIEDKSIFQTDIFQEKVGNVVDVIVSGSYILENLSPLLESPDNIFGSWLMIAMTNVEAKTQGGFPGAWVEVDLDSNGLSMTDIEGVPDMNNNGLSDEYLSGDSYTMSEKTLYSTTMNPRSDSPFEMFDFNRTAENALLIWKTRMENRVEDEENNKDNIEDDNDINADNTNTDNIDSEDKEYQGVVAIDPIFFENIVASFDTPLLVESPYLDENLTLTGDNTSSFLLNQVYLDYPDNTVSDEIFAIIAKTAFNRLLTFELDISSFINGLASSIENHHFLIYSTDKSIERKLLKQIIGGDILSQIDNNTLGIFVNDRSASKMDWYLDADCTINEDNTITITFTNTIKDDEKENYPLYIAGDNPNLRTPCDMGLLFYIVVPNEYKVKDFLVDEQDIYYKYHSKNQDIYYDTVWILPEESSTITFSISSEKDEKITNIRTNLLNQISIEDIS